MSRYVSLVDALKAQQALSIPDSDVLLECIVQGNEVEVAHGYDDAPRSSYFCDLMPDCEVGIYYGRMGLGKKLGKWEYIEAMRKLGLEDAANAVALDIPY